MASILPIDPFHVLHGSCRYGIEKVNELAQYVKDDSEDVDPCSSVEEA
jgi:hypothetical protein